MVALYLSGRQADALRAYKRARDLLVGELGIEPSARLRQLETDVLQQRVEGWTDSKLHRPIAEPGRSRERRPSRSPPGLIGRGRESAALDEQLERVLMGEPLVAVVSGEAGIGKTRLLEAFRARAAGLGAPRALGRELRGRGDRRLSTGRHARSFHHPGMPARKRRPCSDASGASWRSSFPSSPSRPVTMTRRPWSVIASCACSTASPVCLRRRPAISPSCWCSTTPTGPTRSRSAAGSRSASYRHRPGAGRRRVPTRGGRVGPSRAVDPVGAAPFWTRCARWPCDGCPTRTSLHSWQLSSGGQCDASGACGCGGQRRQPALRGRAVEDARPR